jgi:multidrug/hemolysin transport system ATP-binding protein
VPLLSLDLRLIDYNRFLNKKTKNTGKNHKLAPLFVCFKWNFNHIWFLVPLMWYNQQMNISTIPLIAVKNLTKSFNNKIVVDDFSFDVHPGSFFALLGPNGAGKSTIINTLIGLLKLDSGQIIYDGGKAYDLFKKQIGVLFQHNVSDDELTVKENLYFHGMIALDDKIVVSKKIEDLLKLFDLAHVADQRFKTLSGGEKRKTELARTLFYEPQILFLDEPTTGLDPKSRQAIWKTLLNIKKEFNTTIFLTTHYLEEVENADDIIIIAKGKRLCQGTPAELKLRYSHNRLIVVPRDYQQFEELLKTKNLTYDKKVDHYAIAIDDYNLAISLLNEFKDTILNFEFLNGRMDDVFLNVVGDVSEDL